MVTQRREGAKQTGKKFYMMSKNKATLPKQRKDVPLDGGGIDTLSQLLSGALEQAGVNRKDTIRLRLAAEEILGLRGKRYAPSGAAPGWGGCT